MAAMTEYEIELTGRLFAYKTALEKALIDHPNLTRLRARLAVAKESGVAVLHGKPMPDVQACFDQTLDEITSNLAKRVG